MIRRIPVIPTIIVLAAAATMIGLGVWQLQRMHWKEALLAHHSVALVDDEPIGWPTDPSHYEDAYYRQSSVTCATVTKLDAMAGRNSEGESGWVQIAECSTAMGNPAAIQLGWSRNPAPVEFGGGSATGRIAPYGDSVRLIAYPPLAGLDANARPDPSDIPNNHFGYAIQWFLFAGIALVIYALALRKRWRG